MKKPTTANFFELGRLFSMLGIKDEIKEVMRSKSDGTLTNDDFGVGYDLIMKIMDRAVQKNSEQEIYAFLASASGLNPEELQDPSVFLTVIKDIKDSPEWRQLFQSAAELLFTK